MDNHPTDETQITQEAAQEAAQEATQEANEIPPINFITFVEDLVATARVYMAGIHNPETDEVVVNLPLVKRIIDSLELIEEKTKGNLVAPEANFLANSLYELRMGYVRLVSSAEEAAPNDEQTEEAEEEE